MRKRILVFLLVLTMAVGLGCKKADPAPQEQAKQAQQTESGAAEYVTVRITAANGQFVFTTGKSCEFDHASVITLDNGKRVWIGTNYVAEEQ